METFGAVEFGVVDFLSKSHSSSAFVCHHKRWIILNKSCVVFSCTNKWKNVKQDKRSLEIPKCLGQVLNCGIVKMSDYLFYQIINLSCSCAEHVDLHPMSVFRMMWTLYKFILTLWNHSSFLIKCQLLPHWPHQISVFQCDGFCFRGISDLLWYPTLSHQAGLGLLSVVGWKICLLFKPVPGARPNGFRLSLTGLYLWEWWMNRALRCNLKSFWNL